MKPNNLIAMMLFRLQVAKHIQVTQELLKIYKLVLFRKCYIIMFEIKEGASEYK